MKRLPWIAPIVLLVACSTTTDDQRRSAREARYARSAAAGHVGTTDVEAEREKAVRVTLNPDQIKGCLSLGVIRLYADDPDHELRSGTVKLGGNAAVATAPLQYHEVRADGRSEPIDSGDKHTTVLVPDQIIGEAYRCPIRSSQSEESVKKLAA